MTIRRCSQADLAAYAAIQDEEWGSMAADRLQLEARFERFPEGFIIAEHEGRVVGGLSLLRLSSFDIDEGLSWYEITDDGWGTNHDHHGPILFGVDLSVSRHAPRGTSRELVASGLELGMRLGTDSVVWGSRIPRYHKYADQMSATEYTYAKNERGRYLDPEIEVYSRTPRLKIVGVVPNYYKDEESLDHGVVVEWSNPIRHLPFLRPFAGHILQLLYSRSRRKRSRS